MLRLSSRPGSWYRLLVAALAVVFAATACGSDDGDDGGGASDASTTTAATDDDGGDGDDSDDSALPDPCGVLTSADFSAATGLSFGEGTFNTQLSAPDRRICDWINDDPYATGQVLIGPASFFAGSREGVEGTLGEPTVDVDIPGADDAYTTEEGSVIGMLVGDVYLQVSYLPPGPGAVLEITTGLATKAVANL